MSLQTPLEELYAQLRISPLEKQEPLMYLAAILLLVSSKMSLVLESLDEINKNLRLIKNR